MHRSAVTDVDMSSRYLVGLTIAPAFLSASIYLCLSRIIVIFGRNISRFRPAVYTITFICFDLFSLILQAAGGAIAASSDEDSQSQTGVNIMIAGLSFQVVSLFLFMSMCADFAFAVWRNKLTLDPAHSVLRGTAKFKAFLVGMISSPVCRHVRTDFDLSAFRVNAVHLHPILLPCRRAQRRLQRQTRKPRS